MRWSERRTAVRFTFCDDFHPFTPIDARSCPPSLILFWLDAFPRSRAWTPIQKWLITSLALLALAAFGILVYKYERYHRGPSESAFFGTWETTFVGLDSPCYFRLR